MQGSAWSSTEPKAGPSLKQRIVAIHVSNTACVITTFHEIFLCSLLTFCIELTVAVQRLVRESHYVSYNFTYVLPRLSSPEITFTFFAEPLCRLSSLVSLLNYYGTKNFLSSCLNRPIHRSAKLAECKTCVLQRALCLPCSKARVEQKYFFNFQNSLSIFYILLPRETCMLP